jgi:hypothetical protein
MDQEEFLNSHTEEFLAEEPIVIERRGRDLDGYVGKDGRAAPHQSPEEVEREKDVQAEEDAELFGIPEREEP